MKNKKTTNKKRTNLILLFAILLFSILSVNSENITNNPTQEPIQDNLDNSDNQDNQEILIDIDELIEENPEETIEQIPEQSNETQEEVIAETTEQINNITEQETPEQSTETQEEVIAETTELSEETNTKSQENIEYIDLEEIIEESTKKGNSKTETTEEITQPSSPTDTPQNQEEPINSEKKIKIILSKNGKTEIEGEIPESIDINEIKKTEIKKSDFKKQVKISSEKHIEDPLKAYADLPTQAKKEDIKVYWVNEDKEIPIIDYIDQDNNDLYDRISWTVPHLSEQIFEIIINFSTEENSTSLSFNLTKPNNEEVTNPVEFKFEIDYKNLSILNCTIVILKDSEQELDITSNNTQHALPDGNYNWWIRCRDKNTGIPIGESEHKTFTINENYSLTTEQENYLLDSSQKIRVNVNSRNNANVKLELIKPSGSFLTLTSSLSTPNTYEIDRGEITREGIYKVNATFDNLAQPYSKTTNFTVAKVYLIPNETKVEKGDEIEINLTISSPERKINEYKLKIGEEQIDVNWPHQDSVSKKIKHTCNEKGNFSLNLEIKFEKGNAIEITKNTIQVTDSKDNEDPKIKMINPEEDEIVHEEPIIFAFNASDNVKIDNCTFSLYNATGNNVFKSFGEDNLVHRQVKTEIENGRITEISMTNFDERDYFWEVECYDNSTNKKSREIFFTVSFPNNTTILATETLENTYSDLNYYEKQEVDEVTRALEEFLDKQESFSLDEKQILEDLGLSKDLNYYSRRLIQIDQDLGSNIKFISDDSLREQRKKEILEEFQEIKQKVPTDLKMLEKHEYIKNSLTEDIQKIIKEYLEAQNQEINKKNLKKLADINYEIQNYLTASTKISQVEITYPDRTRKLTLITKEINLKNESFERILEVIPKEVIENTDEITFLTENTIIKKDPLIEFSIDDIENDKIIYYVEELIDPEEIEKTDTLLFKQFEIKKMGITGFFALDFGGFGNFAYYLILIIFIIVIIYLALLCTKKIRIYNWKKEEDVVRIFNLIKETKKALIRGDMDSARDKYHKIKELYPLIPKACRTYLYKDIKKIQIGIDKIDISNLVKEYETAKKEKRTEDAKNIYENIKATYKRLPKKYQEKIYSKMFAQQTSIL